MLLAIFGFMALALAPLAAPAAAAANACSAEMMGQHQPHHQMPAQHDSQGHAQYCCAGLTSTLPAPAPMSSELRQAKALVVASPITKLNGLSPAAADPPPRAV